MQAEHWIMVANSRQILYFADSVGRKKYSFLKQHYEQMTQEPLQSHHSVSGYYRIYAAFHSYNSDKKKLQEFTMLMYFHSKVNRSSFSFSLR